VICCTSLLYAVRHSHRSLLRKLGNVEVWSLRSQGWCRGLKFVPVPSCCYRRALPIHMTRHFCCRMYRSATIHSVTERQTDRQTDDVQCYGLKIMMTRASIPLEPIATPGISTSSPFPSSPFPSLPFPFPLEPLPFPLLHSPPQIQLGVEEHCWGSAVSPDCKRILTHLFYGLKTHLVAAFFIFRQNFFTERVINLE